MSYNTDLQSQNARIQALIDKANALPEAGIDTSDATASASDILSGKTAYVNGAKKTGTMTDNGAVAGTISTKNGVYNVPVGYHNGSGKVQIASAERNKIIPENIRSGVTILGVSGTAGSTSTQTVKGTFIDTYESYPFTAIYLSDGSKVTVASGETKTFNVARNTMIAMFVDYSAALAISGGLTLIEDHTTNNYFSSSFKIYLVTGEFTITTS